ncbi:dentin sialophosphoprotein [Halyomorpha halys]|uniref:dentin sialophosphoprotein n=1 Tax=Halyomorpha halys TaxID=286706 RepID=UPI0034D317C1
MTDSSNESNFYVPEFIRRTFRGLLSPGQKLEEIFDQVSGVILEGSDEIRPDEIVWGSKTMTLNNKKPRTLDMFFQKVVKTEASDADSNCSVNSNDESVIEESSKIKSSPHSKPQKSFTEKESKKNAAVMSTKIKTQSRQHSISSSGDESLEKKGRYSPTYSVDLFAEETEKSSDHPNKANSEHSLSDEDSFPSSQVQQSSSRFSLSSSSNNKSSSKTSDKSSAGFKHSESTNNPVSRQNSSKKSNTQNIIQDKELSSSSSSDEDEEEPIMSKLDSIKNKMTNLKEVFSKIESNTGRFSFGDLTEDDELYILRCPREVDSKKLEGVELTLEGNSVVSVDENIKYDYISSKETLKSYLYVALPDSNELGIKLGVFRLAGNIFLSESLDLPYSKPIEDDVLDTVTQETCNTSLNEESSVKKKKKHRKSDHSLDETASSEIYDKEIINQVASKKKKRKHTNLECSDVESRFSEFENFPNVKTECEEAEIIPDTQDQETPLKKKKKRKRSKEVKELNTDFSDFNNIQVVKTDWEDSQIIPDTQDQETPLKTKKKKRIKEGKESNTSFSDLNNSQVTKTDWEDSQIIPDTQDQETPLKTKKKKKRSKEDKDLNSSFSDLSNVRIAKTEWEDSEVIPDTQDQEMPLKVKKKSRRSKEDPNEDEGTKSEFFTENVGDVLNKLASEKKKRKHQSLGSNDFTDSEFDQFSNIKIKWEEPQVISDFQETPSKSKKRSRKYLEGSEEFSKEEVPKKKKKKKHSKYNEV